LTTALSRNWQSFVDFVLATRQDIRSRGIISIRTPEPQATVEPSATADDGTAS
jgi:hypothetical protein